MTLTLPSTGSFSIRAPIYSPTDHDEPVWLEDGVIHVADGKIVDVRAASPTDQAADATLSSRYVLSPGFIDTHLHAPQIEMIGSYGGDLLEWLERHTFPTEARFGDDAHATRVADALFPLLLRYGTTTALLFSSVHTAATRRFFESARRSGIRAIIGKTMMDRNAPDSILEGVEESITGSRELVAEWHGGADGLLGFAITPRFAPTSTPELLAGAGKLAEEYPTTWIQTHISENLREVQLVKQLFSGDRDYASVYDRFGLLRRRTVLAHGVHLSRAELERIAARSASIAHCPNSNLYLGSGLFPLDEVEAAGIPIGLGTDIGAGTTPSMLNAMADTYKVQQVRGRSLDPGRLWSLATIEGARALDLDHVTGSLEPGKDADFIILDLEATDLLDMRARNAETIDDLLAACIFVGDERCIAASYVRGRRVHG